MSHGKNLYRTKTNSQGKTVFDGSVSQGGKQAPTAAPVTPVASEGSSGNDNHLEQRIIHIKRRLDTTRPFPQANSLAKVASVIDAVSGSADTDEGIASAIGVVGRQGSYYANAAAYLGFIQEGGGAPRSWTLTAQGIDFLNSTASERVDILIELVMTGKISSVASTLLDTNSEVDDAEQEVANSESLADSTAHRRVATINSWINMLTSVQAMEELALEHDGVRERLPEAAKIAAEARKRIRNSGTSPELVICTSCYMAKSVTGICNCN